MAEQPNTAQTNRARMRGDGVGRRDLDAPRDPHRNDVDLELSPDGQLSGEPLSFDEPELGDGAVFSSNHARRGLPTEADRGHGPKTAKANKDKISRR